MPDAPPVESGNNTGEFPAYDAESSSDESDKPNNDNNAAIDDSLDAELMEKPEDGEKDTKVSESGTNADETMGNAESIEPAKPDAASPEEYDPVSFSASTASAKDVTNPFIIESEPEDATEEGTNGQDPDVSVFQNKTGDNNEDDDDDDEYEPSAPILAAKKSPALGAQDSNLLVSKVTSSLPLTPQLGTPEAYRATPELPNATSTRNQTPEISQPAGARVSSSGPPPNAPKGPAASTKRGNKSRKRLNLDVIGHLEDKLKENPNDISLWQDIIDIYKSKDKVELLRETYEKVLEIFPLAAKFWVDYIELELAHGEFLNVEKLFGRSLPTVYSVDLMKKYLEYVLRMNNVETNGEKARTTIQQTYDFVLDKVGLDRESGSIWSQYIDFVRSKDTPTTWEQQQQMDSLRKIFRKAICIPLNNVESLWHDYNSFENNINKSTARKFVAEKSAVYMTARSCLRELENITHDINRTSIPKARKWSQRELKQVEKWKTWARWEEKNPLEATEKSVVYDRVSYVYKQAISVLWFFPEIWFEAANYALNKETEGETEALEILQMGMKANPTSSLIFLKTSEILEYSGKKEEALKTYKSLLENLKAGHAKFEARYNALKENTETKRSKLQSVERALDARSKEITYTYISYMTAVKRMEGISQARQVFSECRKLAYSTYHIYLASASMELRNDKPDIATKIFEIGLKRFGQNADYIGEYIQFLIRINDDTNARALFEKSVTKMEPKEAKPLYDEFLKYESQFGDMVSLKKLEKRYNALFPEGMFQFPFPSIFHTLLTYYRTSSRSFCETL